MSSYKLLAIIFIPTILLSKPSGLQADTVSPLLTSSKAVEFASNFCDRIGIPIPPDY